MIKYHCYKILAPVLFYFEEFLCNVVLVGSIIKINVSFSIFSFFLIIKMDNFQINNLNKLVNNLK